MGPGGPMGPGAMGPGGGPIFGADDEGGGNPFRPGGMTFAPGPGMMGPGGPMGAGGPGGVQDGYISTGFPGINSGSMGFGGGGGMLGRRQPEPDFGAMGPMGGMGGMGAGQQPEAPPIVEPNGIAIQGYTESPEAFKEFVDNLKLSNKFIEVYYSEADLVEVSEYEMYQAPVIAQSVGGGFSAMGDDDGRPGRGRGGFAGGGLAMGGIGGGIGGGFGGAPRGNPYAGGNVPQGGKQILRFRVDAQFQGDPVPQPTVSIASGGRPGGIGGGFGGRRTGRSDRKDDL